MRDFRELKVWEKAHQVTLAVYKTTRSFPREELYGLTSQIRDASSSVPSNIAEGCGRGSAAELEYRLLLARDLAYLDRSQYQTLSPQVIEVKRMLGTFIGKIRSGN